MPGYRFLDLAKRVIPALGMGLLGVAPLLAADAPVRERVNFNADWRFQKGDPPGVEGTLDYPNLKAWLLASSNAFAKTAADAPAGEPPGADVACAQPAFDDSGWRKLNLPHDWGIEGPFKQEYAGETGKLPWWGVAWYRKHFELPAADKGRQVFLDIDGAMSYAAVWCNGKFAGGWPYGYSSFRVNLTPFVKAGGPNVVAIRLDNPPDSSRWYPGGGIYRNVWLVTTAPVHVAHWGTVITTPDVAREAATVKIETRVANDSSAKAGVTVRTRVFAIPGKNEVLTRNPGLSPADADAGIEAGQSAVVTQTLAVKNPRLWSVETPNLYRAVTQIVQDGKVVDETETTFGIRRIEFTADRGFLLNGERVPLQGVCNHSDLGALGTAFNLRAAERQLEIMKEMGVNALRTTHNPPAPELLDLCDRMGILVMDESFDCWRISKRSNDYGGLFDDWSERDLRALIRRDRNHPSVVIWSVGNEVRDQMEPEGAVTAKRLVDIAHEEDGTRPATVACSDTPAGYSGFQKGFDVFGFNYRGDQYGPFHDANPTIPIFGSETASTVSSRGEYFFPVIETKDGGKSDFQMSSYDLYAPPWAWPPDVEFKALDEQPVALGEFVWTGFDYLGEPTPYNRDPTTLLNFSDPAAREKARKELAELGKFPAPSRSSYFGIVDLAGFKKDRFYLYQARWRPDLPMAHILPHWTWPGREGEVTPVHVYTSGDEAELFLNGKSLGRKKRGEFDYRLRWDDVKYAPGELRVIAYKGGKRWAEDAVRTAGPVEKVTLQSDRATLRADGSDLAFVTATLSDKDGRPVPKSDNAVAFEVSGPAEIVATDNGDATSHAPFQAKERAAYNGLALAILRTKPGETGEIRLKATSPGLKGGEVTLQSIAP